MVQAFRYWLIATFLVLIFTHMVIRLRNPVWLQTWQFYFWPVLSLDCCGLALVSFIQGNWTAGVLNSAYAAIAAWLWWTDHRDRRKKLIDKVLGRVVVRDAGLKVVPE